MERNKRSQLKSTVLVTSTKKKCQDRAKGELSIICKVSKETFKANSTLGGRHSLHTGEVPKPRDQNSLPATIPHKHRTFHAETPGATGTPAEGAPRDQARSGCQGTLSCWANMRYFLSILRGAITLFTANSHFC